MNTTAVQWRPVVGLEDAYEVSEFGNIRSVDRLRRVAHGAFRLCKGRPTKPAMHYSGYLKIGLCYGDGLRRTTYVHTIVLEAFVGKPQPNLQGCHNDGNKLNNHYSNLRWGTAIENCADKIRHGTVVMGSKHPRAKLNEDDILKIRSDGRVFSEIARDYGVTSANISAIKIGRSWKHIQHNG